MRFLLSVLLLLIVAVLNSQGYSEIYGEEIFLFNHPSAKVESMGRTSSVTIDGMFSVFNNPAIISKLDRVTASISKNSPLYMHNDSEFLYAGVGFSFLRKFSLGFSIYDLDFGEEVDTGALIYKPYIRNSMLTLGFKANRALSFGLNGNYLEFNTINEGKEVSEKVFSFDLGVHSVINSIRNHNLRQIITISVAAKNLVSQELRGDHMPCLITAGIEFLILPTIRNPFSSTLKSTLFTINGEYQKGLYSEHTQISGGIELLLSEIIALRAGYYRQQINDQIEEITGTDYELNKFISSFTYGAGLSIPLYRFQDLNIPIKINLDYSKLPMPERTNRKDIDIDDITNISMTIAWVTDFRK